jgi:hypothetical protein
VLRVSNVLWVPELKRSVLSISEIEKKVYHILFRDGQVLFVPRRSNFRSTAILGVKEGNLYRLRDQPMRAVNKSRKETDEEEQVAPLVVQVQREQIAPPMVQAQKEL